MRVSDAFEITLFHDPYGVSGARPDGRREEDGQRENQPHKDPLSFCFQPHENRKRGETTKYSQLLRPLIRSLQDPGLFYCLSGTDAH